MPESKSGALPLRRRPSNFSCHIRPHSSQECRNRQIHNALPLGDAPVTFLPPASLITGMPESPDSQRLTAWRRPSNFSASGLTQSQECRNRQIHNALPLGDAPRIQERGKKASTSLMPSSFSSSLVPCTSYLRLSPTAWRRPNIFSSAGAPAAGAHSGRAPRTRQPALSDTAPVSPARPPHPPPAETRRRQIRSFGHRRNYQATSMRYPLPGTAGEPPAQGHSAPGPRENRVL